MVAFCSVMSHMAVLAHYNIIGLKIGTLTAGTPRHCLDTSTRPFSSFHVIFVKCFFFFWVSNQLKIFLNVVFNYTFIKFCVFTILFGITVLSKL